MFFKVLNWGPHNESINDRENILRKKINLPMKLFLNALVS
jgi:hypothetical protein